MKFVLLASCIGLLSLSFMGTDSSLNEKEVSHCARMLNYVAALKATDLERTKAEEKVSSIINRFNPAMKPHMKKRIGREIYEMSIKYANLDVDLICATITHESGRKWASAALSRAGAMGLMQIMPATGIWLAGREGIHWTSSEDILYDPIYNIRLGSRYLAQLIEHYELEGGLAAYNGGGRRARMWLQNNKADGILWDETRAYIPHVLKLYGEFKDLSL